MKSSRKMLSPVLMSMIAKRGASSMAGKGIEFSGERDFEDSSKPKGVEVEASGSLEILGEVGGNRAESIAVRTSERKRVRRAVEEVARPLEKKSKGVIKLRSGGADVREEVVGREIVEPSGDEAFSAVRAAAAAKGLLDQFTLEFDRLVALGVRGNLELELSRLRADLLEAQEQKADAEKRIASLARKNRDAHNSVAALEKRVEALSSDKDALNALVSSYQNIESEFAAEKSQMRVEYCSVIAELGKSKICLENELVKKREALMKSHEEALDAFENGYGSCWDRAAKAGCLMEPHTFALYCEDVAKAREEGDDSANRQGSVA